MEIFDVVMPKGNEDEMIEMAISLGYPEIVFLSDNINYRHGSSDKRIKLKTAILLKDINMIHKARKGFDYIFAYAERRFFEQDVDYILDAELSGRKDSFHYRNTSLNQVHAKLARQNHSTIIFDFNLLLGSWGRARQMLLGRMIQNAVIARKYKLKFSAFSMAKVPEEMRSRTILDALENVLGF